MKDLLISFPIRNRSAKVLDLIIQGIKLNFPAVQINIVNMLSDQVFLDGYISLAEKHNIRLIDVTGTEKFNKPIAMNAGVVHARDSFKYVINADVDIFWTQELCNEIKSHLDAGYKVVMARCTYLPEKYRIKNGELLFSFLKRARFERVVKRGLMDKDTSVKQSKGSSFMVVAKEIFWCLGGHDETFCGWGYEDDEWFDRVSISLDSEEELVRCKEFGLHYWHEKNWFNEKNKIGNNNKNIYDVIKKELSSKNRPYFHEVNLGTMLASVDCEIINY